MDRKGPNFFVLIRRTVKFFTNGLLVMLHKKLLKISLILCNLPIEISYPFWYNKDNQGRDKSPENLKTRGKRK